MSTRGATPTSPSSPRSSRCIEGFSITAATPAARTAAPPCWPSPATTSDCPRLGPSRRGRRRRRSSAIGLAPVEAIPKALAASFAVRRRPLRDQRGVRIDVRGDDQASRHRSRHRSLAWATQWPPPAPACSSHWCMNCAGAVAVGVAAHVCRWRHAVGPVIEVDDSFGGDIRHRTVVHYFQMTIDELIAAARDWVHPERPDALVELMEIFPARRSARRARRDHCSPHRRLDGVQGKSTTVAALVSAYRARHMRVAVLAVDPSSPYSGAEHARRPDSDGRPCRRRRRSHPLGGHPRSSASAPRRPASGRYCLRPDRAGDGGGRRVRDRDSGNRRPDRRRPQSRCGRCGSGRQGGSAGSRGRRYEANREGADQTVRDLRAGADTQTHRRTRRWHPGSWWKPSRRTAPTARNDARRVRAHKFCRWRRPACAVMPIWTAWRSRSPTAGPIPTPRRTAPRHPRGARTCYKVAITERSWASGRRIESPTFSGSPVVFDTRMTTSTRRSRTSPDARRSAAVLQREVRLLGSHPLRQQCSGCHQGPRDILVAKGVTLEIVKAAAAGHTGQFHWKDHHQFGSARTRADAQAGEPRLGAARAVTALESLVSETIDRYVTQLDPSSFDAVAGSATLSGGGHHIDARCARRRYGCGSTRVSSARVSVCPTRAWTRYANPPRLYDLISGAAPTRRTT